MAELSLKPSLREISQPFVREYVPAAAQCVSMPVWSLTTKILGSKLDIATASRLSSDDYASTTSRIALNCPAPFELTQDSALN